MVEHFTPAKWDWEPVQTTCELPIFSFCECDLAEGGCCPLSAHLWGAVQWQVVSWEDEQGAPYHFRSIDSYWDYTKGCKIEPAKAVVHSKCCSAALEGEFCSDLTSDPHTASLISLGTAPGTAAGTAACIATRPGAGVLLSMEKSSAK